MHPPSLRKPWPQLPRLYLPPRESFESSVKGSASFQLCMPPLRTGTRLKSVGRLVGGSGTRIALFTALPSPIRSSGRPVRTKDNVCTPYRIRTDDLRLERAVSWATRRTGLVGRRIIRGGPPSAQMPVAAQRLQG